MKMNLPNKLTIFRMILVIFMAAVPVVDYFMGGIPGSVCGVATSFIIMDAIFIIASITDKLDGYLARKNNEVTTFGKFLDPIADKILVISALTILVEFGRIPSWIPIIVITREFIVSGYRLVAVEKGGKVIAASMWGKLKTVTQMVAIILIFLDNNAYASFLTVDLPTGAKVFNIVTSLLITISVVATIFSGVDYLRGGKDLFKDEEK